MKNLFFILIVLFSAAYAYADAGTPDAPADTSRVYRMNEVTITGSRMATDVRRLPSAVSVVNEQTIERSNGTAVSDILQGVPGIFMKTYGGSGSLQTISSRGMGPEYTLVLVDGQRYTNFQNGQVDLGIFSAADIDRIEVARGGYSALFGADAVGGVVNIITKKPAQGIHAEALAGAGSFGFQQYQLSLSGGTEAVALKGTYRNEHSSNMFDCYFHDGPKNTLINRTDADYAFSIADIGATVKSGGAFSSTVSMRYAKADRGVPSALTSFSNTGGAARLLDKDYFTQYSAEWKTAEASRLLIQSNFHYTEQQYNDPMLENAGQAGSYYYFNRAVMMTPRYEASIGEGSTIVAGAEIARAWIVSSVVLNKTRTQASAFISSQHRLLFNAGLPYELTIFPSVRYDRFSDVSDAFDPKLGINIGVQDVDALRLRASIGKSFRVPAFNDLYWIGGGNEALQPEHSVSFDAGALSTLTWMGVIDLEADYYLIDTKDRILWLPGANNIWSPKNISRVRSEGVELSARWSLWDDAVTLGYTQTIMSVARKSNGSVIDPNDGKQLPYLPDYSGSFSAGFRYSNLTMNLRIAMTGERYTTEDNNPRYALDPYASVDANLGYRIVMRKYAAKIKLEALNLFNADYEIIAQQPMPLRQLRLSLEVLY